MSQTSDEYQKSLQALIDSYDSLYLAPRGGMEGKTRAIERVPASTFIAAAQRVADHSAALNQHATALLAEGSAPEREAVSAQLLAQSVAEMSLASELWQLVAQERDVQALPRAAPGKRINVLHMAIVELRDATLYPLQEGLSPYLTARPRAAPAVAAPGTGAETLRSSVAKATQGITRQTVDLSGAIALDLVMQTRWAAVLDGALLLRGDAAQKLGEVKQGLGGVVAKAASAAETALLNVYDKLLALLGKDAEDVARTQIRDWLEKIKEDGRIAIVENLVNGLFRVDAFQSAMETWLTQTSVPDGAIGKTAGEVEAVSEKFALLCKRLNTLENAVGLAKLTGIPQVMLVVAGLQVGMLAVAVYAGYDCIGFEQKRFLDITPGVAQVVRRNLAIT